MVDSSRPESILDTFSKAISPKTNVLTGEINDGISADTLGGSLSRSTVVVLYGFMYHLANFSLFLKGH